MIVSIRSATQPNARNPTGLQLGLVESRRFPRKDRLAKLEELAAVGSLVLVFEGGEARRSHLVAVVQEVG
eukprot:13864019-Heterocapsa_arctica.AAC.1